MTKKIKQARLGGISFDIEGSGVQEAPERAWVVAGEGTIYGHLIGETNEFLHIRLTRDVMEYRYLEDTDDVNYYVGEIMTCYKSQATEIEVPR